MTSNQQQLLDKALQTIGSFAVRLPGLLTYFIEGKKSWTPTGGKAKHGNYAVLRVYIKGKRASRALVDELLIDTVATPIVTPIQINAAETVPQPVAVPAAPPVAVPAPAPASPAQTTQNPTQSTQPAVPAAPPSTTVGAPLPTAAPVPTAKPPIPTGLFQENEAYKFTNDLTVYVFQSGRLRGVATPQGFALFYNKPFVIGKDLSTYHPIRPMPDLTNYAVPSDFFSGTVIQ